MPERSKAVGRLINGLHSDVWYNNADWTMHVDGEKLDTEARDAFMDKHYEAYDTMVKRIDWNRVLLEAMGCHLARQSVNPEHKTEFKDYDDQICPDCVMQALLMDGTIPNWEKLAEELERENAIYGCCTRCGKIDREGSFCELMGESTVANPDGGTGEPICPACVEADERQSASTDAL